MQPAPADQGFRARIVSRARDWVRGTPLHAFGGRPLLEAELPVSSRCGRPFHLTLDLDLADPRLAGLGITSVRRLALLACFHVDYRAGAPLFIRHADEGRRLELLREPRGRLIESLPLELPQLPVELEPLNEAEAAVESLDELPDDSPPLHRVGGHAVWAKGPVAPPSCPDTGRPMRYVASVDSMRRFPLAEGEASLLFADGGVCYVFWSDAASISASVVQPR
jgi:hypothetical protein